MSDHPPILLVEDNPLDVDLTLRAFQRCKLANPILVARDGEEALEWVPRWVAGNSLPVLILLDLNMPRIDGLTVLRTLKAHTSLRRIPIAVLTTSLEERDIQSAYDAGANSYIAKPVDFDRFIDMARQIELYWCVINKLPG